MPSPTSFPPGHRARDAYGDYEVIAVDGEYRLVRYDDGQERRRPLALLRLAAENRLNDSYRLPPQSPPERAKTRDSRPAAGESSFLRDETSPLVADLIGRLAGPPPAFVTHDQLVAALLADPGGRRLIARAPEVQGDNPPARGLPPPALGGPYPNQAPPRTPRWVWAQVLWFHPDYCSPTIMSSNRRIVQLEALQSLIFRSALMAR